MSKGVKMCALCGATSDTTAIHVHHVLGRVGTNKDNPENLINLCAKCHHVWHQTRPKTMQDRIYKIMKLRYGEKFPIYVNGHRYYPKWLLETEKRNDPDGQT